MERDEYVTLKNKPLTYVGSIGEMDAIVKEIDFDIGITIANAKNPKWRIWCSNREKETSGSWSQGNCTQEEFNSDIDWAVEQILKGKLIEADDPANKRGHNVVSEYGSITCAFQ